MFKTIHEQVITSEMLVFHKIIFTVTADVNLVINSSSYVVETNIFTVILVYYFS